MEGDSFNAYVERYCKSYKVTPDEAKELAIVREVKKYYEETERG